MGDFKLFPCIMITEDFLAKAGVWNRIGDESGLGSAERESFSLGFEELCEFADRKLFWEEEGPSWFSISKIGFSLAEFKLASWGVSQFAIRKLESWELTEWKLDSEFKEDMELELKKVLAPVVECGFIRDQNNFELVGKSFKFFFAKLRLWE